MDCPWCLHLVIALASLLFFAHTMLFKEKLVLHVKVGIVAYLHPSTKAVPVDTSQQHTVFFRTPRAGVVGSLCSVGQTE